MRLKEDQPVFVSARGNPNKSPDLSMTVILTTVVAIAAVVAWDVHSKLPKTDPVTHGDPNIILTDPNANLELRCYWEKFNQRCLEVFDPRWMDEMCDEYEDDMKFADDIQMTALLRDSEVLGPLDLAKLVRWQCFQNEGTGMHYTDQAINEIVFDKLTPEQLARFLPRDGSTPKSKK